MSNSYRPARSVGRDNSDTPAAYLQSTPDEVVVISTVHDRPNIALRITFRNGHAFLIDTDAMKWLLRHDLKGIGDDFLPALVALLARRWFREIGGKKWQGCSLQQWLVGRDYPGVAVA